VMMVGHKAVEE